MSNEDDARRVLSVTRTAKGDFETFRTGARTRAVLATRPGIAHRLSGRCGRVLIKLYKGDGSTKGSKAYQVYHQHDFRLLNALTGNGHVQQSFEGGVFPGVGPYALLEFVEGQELAEVLSAGSVSPDLARRILEDILLEIWIPLWAAGLRFKDCHPGNFVLTPDRRVVMIDTEQMRKGLAEKLNQPNEWAQRDRHEAQGLSRLPGLIRRIILATGHQTSEAALLRAIKMLLSSVGLPDTLKTLGRGGDPQKAIDEADDLLVKMTHDGFI